MSFKVGFIRYPCSSRAPAAYGFAHLVTELDARLGTRLLARDYLGRFPLLDDDALPATTHKRRSVASGAPRSTRREGLCPSYPLELLLGGFGTSSSAKDEVGPDELENLVWPKDLSVLLCELDDVVGEPSLLALA